ncbi:hypothetical protein EV363DRAFT_1301246 [Boletus edulis]|nr:hypothetical protein EV363DRAFT_1301246 [Boletus edulis]
MTTWKPAPHDHRLHVIVSTENKLSWEPRPVHSLMGLGTDKAITAPWYPIIPIRTGLARIKPRSFRRTYANIFIFLDGARIMSCMNRTSLEVSSYFFVLANSRNLPVANTYVTIIRLTITVDGCCQLGTQVLYTNDESGLCDTIGSMTVAMDDMVTCSVLLDSSLRGDDAEKDRIRRRHKPPYAFELGLDPLLLEMVSESDSPMTPGRLQ